MNFLQRNDMAALAMCAVFGLSGCASMFNTADNDRFACNENKDCPTPLEVYSDTHVSPRELMVGRTPAEWQSGGRSKKDQQLAEKEAYLERTINLTKSVKSVTKNDAGQVVTPLRESAQVMRIWVAPWIDNSDNLNLPGHVFTEIAPRRWAIGEQEVRHAGFPAVMVPNLPQ